MPTPRTADPARPPHDPWTCGLHGPDAVGRPTAYCPRCKLDGDWLAELSAGKAAPPHRPVKPPWRDRPAAYGRPPR